MLVALAYTFRVAELLALTLLLFCDTDSQELPLAGVVEKLNVIGVVLAVDRPTVVETACPVVVLNVTELGLAEMTPLVPPPPPHAPGQKVTVTGTSVPPEAEVGCSVIEPLQVTPPFEQLAFVTETMKLAGAVSAVSLTEKKLPTLLVIVNGPEPDTATCTFKAVPESATGFGVALNCDCERPGTAT